MNKTQDTAQKMYNNFYYIFTFFFLAFVLWLSCSLSTLFAFAGILPW